MPMSPLSLMIKRRSDLGMMIGVTVAPLAVFVPTLTPPVRAMSGMSAFAMFYAAELRAEMEQSFWRSCPS